MNTTHATTPLHADRTRKPVWAFFALPLIGLAFLGATLVFAANVDFHTCPRLADDQFDLCGADLCLSGEGAVDESAYERRRINVAVQFAKANAERMLFASTGAEIAFRNGDTVEFDRWTSAAVAISRMA